MPRVHDPYGVPSVYRQGSRGVSYEAGLYARPWDIEPGGIAKKIRLLHGDEDAVLPISIGYFMAEKNAKDCARVILTGGKDP